MRMLGTQTNSPMANKTILMSRIRQIIRLYTQGQSNKKISELTAPPLAHHCPAYQGSFPVSEQ